MNEEFISPRDIGYRLNKPCSECPFRKDAPYHQGVFVDLPKFQKKIDDGEFLFSCHKTDPRSDSKGKHVGGKVQHCGGALVFQKNARELENNKILLFAYFSKQFNPKRIRKSRKVFANMHEMVLHYFNLYEARKHADPTGK